MSDSPHFERVLILATHPDDDVIGAAGLIQHVISAGGRVRVLFITGGESNVWPQRAVYRKWRIGREEQLEWSKIRSNEARMALRKLGVAPASAFFLGYPDQQVSALARMGDVRLPLDLLHHTAEFDPTLVVSPSHFDIHRDHRATAFFAHTTLRRQIPITTYGVHGRPPSSRANFTVRLTAEQQRQKREAIACHKTQLLLSRERFLAHAGTTETFFVAEHDLVRMATPAEERLSTIRHSTAAVLGVFRTRPFGADWTPEETPAAIDAGLAPVEEGSVDALQTAFARISRSDEFDGTGPGQV